MTTIREVIVKEPKGRRWFVIVDANGEKHATRNQFIAALAERCRDKQTPVSILSASGWHYRDLISLKPEGQEPSVA